MTLLTCPDCEHTVSDQAFACPVCGRPVRDGEFRRHESVATGAEEKPQPSSTPEPRVAQAPEGDDTAPGRHPWIRYWARFVDTIVAVFGLAIVLAVVAPGAFADDESGWSLVFTALFVWVFVEAVMLTAWGTTPGKALMRVRVTRDGSRPPEFGQALGRSFRVWFFGLGIGFPIITAITMLVAYNKLMKRGRTSWDQKLDLRVVHGQVGGLRWIFLVIIVAAVFLMNVAAAGM